MRAFDRVSADVLSRNAVRMSVRYFDSSGSRTDRRLCVGDGEYISKAGSDVLIPVPGGDTVKMTPQAAPSGIGGVGVAAVAVQKDKAAGACSHWTVRILPGVAGHKGERAFLDIHEQKTVKGLPDKPVAGQISKLSALQRIQKHLHGVFAGGIDEISGVIADKRFL